MEKCFVIQPFDGGKFDKRYQDVFAPAICDVGLEPYRVDQDPSVSIPIEDIQTGIANSRICLADISVDNPNVWFEVGFAIASKRNVVLVCSHERQEKFPFDVQHRSIIRYAIESQSDFEHLRRQVTKRLNAVMQKEDQIGKVAAITKIAEAKGLEQYEIATLVVIASQLPEPTGGVSAFMIQRDMEKAGFTKIATTLGVRGLLQKRFLEEFEDQDYDGSYFNAFRVTDIGISWLLQNTDRLNLTIPEVNESLLKEEVPF